MILSLIVLLLIVFNVYYGFRDGLVYEFIQVICYLVAWILALHFAHPFGVVVNQFLGLDSAMINGLSFLIILVVSIIILKSIGRVINRVTNFPIIHQLNAIGGAVAGFLVGYLLVFILLNVCLVLPSSWLQNEYTNSPIALRIVNHTPGVTNNLMNKWLK